MNMKVLLFMICSMVVCCTTVGPALYAAGNPKRFDFVKTVKEFRQARDAGDFKEAHRLINTLEDNYQESYANRSETTQKDIREKIDVASVSEWIKKNKTEMLQKRIAQKEAEQQPSKVYSEEEEKERARLIAKLENKKNKKGKGKQKMASDAQAERDIKEAAEALEQMSLETMSKDELADMADKFQRIQDSYPEGQEAY